MIIIYHSIPPRYFWHVGQTDITWLYFANGFLAVSGFFILSSYLMGKVFYIGKYNLTWDSIKQFFISRAKRILPLYYFILLIFILFVYTDLQLPSKWGGFLKIFFFMYDGNYPPYFNNAWWAISTEVQFYLLVPIIFFAIKKFIDKKYFNLILLILTICTGALIRFYFHSGAIMPEWLYQVLRFPLVQYLDVFIAGFLLYPLIANNEKLKQFLTKFRLLSIPLFIGLYLISALWWYREPIRSALENQLYFTLIPTIGILLIGLIILMFESNGQPIGSPFKLENWRELKNNPWRALEFLGTISFGIYLWHMAILQTQGSLIVYDGRLWLYFAKTGTTIFWSIILATVTYQLVEKTFIKKSGK